MEKFGFTRSKQTQKLFFWTLKRLGTKEVIPSDYNLTSVIRKRLKINFQSNRISKYAIFLFAPMCTNKCTKRISKWGSVLNVRVVATITVQALQVTECGYKNRSSKFIMEKPLK